MRAVFALVAVALHPSLTAQTTQTFVLPAAAATADLGSSTPYPFDIGACRVLHILSRNHFVAAGINYPVVIRGMRVRANGTTATWTGSSISSLQLDLSTAPFGYSNIVATFDANHGTDRQTLHTGSLAIPGGSANGIGPFHVDIPFTGQFRYDPNQGDLTVDFGSSGVLATANTPALDCSVTTGEARARRVVSTTSTTTGTVTSGESCLALELTCVRDQLVPNFSVAPTSGVCGSTSFQFTDLSTTSDLGGITSWAWDFDNDGLIDSTLRNPTYRYFDQVSQQGPGAGTYSVWLRVADATHGSTSLLRANLVTVTRNPTPGYQPFSWDLSDVIPGLVQFHCPNSRNSYAWDFDGDGVTDSTLQNPLVSLPLGGCSTRPVTLRTQDNCMDHIGTQDILVAHVARWAGASEVSLAVCYLDIDVRPPAGVTLCRMQFHCGVGAGTCLLYDLLPTYTIDLTASTYVGATDWRRVATAGSPGQPTFPGAPAAWYVLDLDNALFLPRGRYGVRISWVAAPNYPTCTLRSRLALSQWVGDVNIRVLGSRTEYGTSSVSPNPIGLGFQYVLPHVESDAPYVGFLGEGCAGSLGIPGLVPVAGSLPQLGQTFAVEVSRLPLDVGAVITGFNNTFSPSFGLLPATTPQMPGCTLFVADDLLDIVYGSGQTATWSTSIPSSASILGIAAFQQTAVPSPGSNALGYVLSEARGYVVGH